MVRCTRFRSRRDSHDGGTLGSGFGAGWLSSASGLSPTGSYWGKGGTMKQHGHHHDDEHHGEHAHHGHGHTHGVVDPSIASTDRGLWVLKWSFAGLMV